ncbi:MAG: hypothetical protein J6P05_01170 [Lachnospiraceae bacterium]|nr:hypothetical protein [Lachnospiraceae bacterium]
MVLKGIYEDENHRTEFDFSYAVNVFEPHGIASRHSEYISDVDFVLESKDEIIFIEYKNVSIAEAHNQGAFIEKIKNGNLTKVLIKKFFGTLLIVLMTNRNPHKKPIVYSCVIEGGKKIDGVMMKKLRNKVRSGLPFDYEKIRDVEVPIIDRFELMSISDWNSKYSQYPIRMK